MSEFVIVIEADNKRAHAAYLKGLADLERIWPQIEIYAASKNEAAAAKHKAEAEVRNAERQQFQARIAAYNESLARWESSLFKGSRPEYPYHARAMLDYLDQMDAIGRSAAFSSIKIFESIRADLKHMADVAGAALGPFRMTEHQVKEMVAWEDGSRIDKIKAGIAEEGAR